MNRRPLCSWALQSWFRYCSYCRSSLHLQWFLLLVYRSPKPAVHYLCWVNQRWRRKPHLLSVGSHPLCKDLLLPWKTFGLYKAKRLKAAGEGSNTFTSVTWEYEVNLKGHPSVNYWICNKLSYPGSQVPLEIQDLNHGLCNIDSSHHLLNAHTSSFLTTLYLQEIKLVQN